MSWRVRDGNLWLRICHSKGCTEAAIRDAHVALMQRQADEPGRWKLRTKVRATMAVYNGSMRCCAVTARVQPIDETPEEYAARVSW